jgi:hypothetical protein
MHILIFVFVFVLLVSRRPDAVFHPQFYAEDGTLWFADAYNFGWSAFTRLAYRSWNSAYSSLLTRLVAQLSLFVPFAYAPLVFNLAALVVAVIPVNVLLSYRSRGWGSIQLRGFMAAAYVALPNCSEVSFGITLAQWNLGLSAILLLVAVLPRSIPGRLFDFTILLVCGLTGPFCIFLFPISVFLLFKDRQPWRWIQTILLGLTFLLEAWSIWLVPGTPPPVLHPHPPLGATPELLFRIVGGQVVFGALAGEIGLAALPTALPLLIILSVLGAFLVTFCLLRSSLPMKLFLLFSLGIGAAALISPLTGNRMPVWQALILVPGVHYWFFPSLAFAWTVLWCAQCRYQPLQIVAGILLVVQCFGITMHWRRDAYPDSHFAESVERLKRAAPGTVVVIPETPPGWAFSIVKRS